MNDIIEIMGIEYLRTMDIGLTEIKDVREAGDISQLSDVLQKKEQDVSGKIKSLLKVQEMLKKAQEISNGMKRLGREIEAAKEKNQLFDSSNACFSAPWNTFRNHFL